MSLVNTASDSSSRSSRHSAATRAVLPEPTGPPTPIRNGSSAVRGRLGRSGWWRCGSPSVKWGAMAGIGLSGDEQWALAFGVALGQHIEQRVGQIGKLLASQVGGLVTQLRQLERQR